ncbi:MAG: 4Fe-4S dicluster domain-containing protein [Planctomycetes bacterium]|nr:4Fe-4S dicluster domain-containing protein [Planctomycetota bacterium]
MTDSRPAEPDKRKAIKQMASGAFDFATTYLPGAGLIKRLDFDALRALYGGAEDDDSAPKYEDMHGRTFFRPPGALAEKEFLETCSRCKKCVEACPEQVITPAQSHMGAPLDTPILMPNIGPCTLCGDCMDICPTGALKPTPVGEVRIGIAVVEPRTCLGYLGEACTACHDACPLEPNAIAFEGKQPKVDSRICTGCGLCVKACPTEQPSIVVLPRPKRS